MQGCAGGVVFVIGYVSCGQDHLRLFASVPSKATLPVAISLLFIPLSLRLFPRLFVLFVTNRKQWLRGLCRHAEKSCSGGHRVRRNVGIFTRLIGERGISAMQCSTPARMLR